ncbi:hypothetical protein FRC00_005236, partial [Tulasnella sp. 408]
RQFLHPGSEEERHTEEAEEELDHDGRPDAHHHDSECDIGADDPLRPAAVHGPVAFVHFDVTAVFADHAYDGFVSLKVSANQPSQVSAHEETLPHHFRNSTSNNRSRIPPTALPVPLLRTVIFLASAFIASATPTAISNDAALDEQLLPTDPVHVELSTTGSGQRQDHGPGSVERGLGELEQREERESAYDGWWKFDPVRARRRGWRCSGSASARVDRQEDEADEFERRDW